jgi:hypothetical protein
MTGVENFRDWTYFTKVNHYLGLPVFMNNPRLMILEHKFSNNWKPALAFGISICRMTQFRSIDEAEE